ncbi:MAG: putative drug exporter of the superfamily [Actinomycetota bacterium]|nr:putative drug exporter of the superfamily [Actinomycetota bacterium]
MSRFLYRLGRFAVRRRRLVLAAWLLALALLVVGGQVAGGTLRDDIKVPGSGSQQAQDVLTAKFPSQAGSSAQVAVHARTGTLTAGRNAAALASALTAIKSLPHVVGASDALSTKSAPGTIALVNVTYDQTTKQLGNRAFTALEAATAPATRAGLQVEYGGDLPSSAVGASLPSTEVIGIIAAMLILLLAFGSVIAMGLPIGTALVGLGAGILSITILSAFVTIPTVATTVAAMIGLGVGIDYSLFVITRHREGLHRGYTVEDAGGRAVATAGQAVLIAGGTVVIAICGLAVAGVAAITFMGIGAAIVVAVMVIAALTLLPSMLGFAGHNIDRFGIPGMKPKHESGAYDEHGKLHGWGRWGHHVAAHPWPYLVGSLAVVLTLTFPMVSLRLGQPDASNDPTSSTLRRSYDLLAQGFGPGFNGPLTVAVDLSAVTGNKHTVVADITKAVAAAPGVDAVRPAIVNPAGDAAVIQVLPTSEPQAAATQQLVSRLRSQVLPQTAATGAHTYIGGSTASNIDLSHRVSSRLLLFIATVIALSFMLLMCVFRSVLVPLKAALMNLLSIGAAYGVIVAIFQKGWGASLVGVHASLPIVSFIPMFMFAVLFGLSMDYEVFLLSRIREAYLATHDNTESVVVGIATTARVITSAALVMISVFLAFVLGDNPTIKMMGIGLATAVFIDATVVRVVLVPAVMRLMGDASWWLPRGLDRLLPHLDIEGEQLLPAPEYTPDRQPVPEHPPVELVYG